LCGDLAKTPVNFKRIEICKDAVRLVMPIGNTFLYTMEAISIIEMNLGDYFE